MKERATLNARKLGRATRQPDEWRKIEKYMKTLAILKQVLTMCKTEQQGVIVGGIYENWREWLRDWFGVDAVLKAGLIDPEKTYFYTYGDPLLGIADAVIVDGGSKVYIYEVEE